MLDQMMWKSYPGKESNKNCWVLVVRDMFQEIGLGKVEWQGDKYRIVARHRSKTKGYNLTIENIFVGEIKKLEKAKTALMEFWRLEWQINPNLVKY